MTVIRFLLMSNLKVVLSSCPQNNPTFCNLTCFISIMNFGILVKDVVRVTTLYSILLSVEYLLSYPLKILLVVPQTQFYFRLKGNFTYYDKHKSCQKSSYRFNCNYGVITGFPIFESIHIIYDDSWL